MAAQRAHITPEAPHTTPAAGHRGMARLPLELLRKQNRAPARLPYITPCAQKGPKKTLRYFFIAFELGIVFCSPCQGEKNTRLSSKAIKKYQMFFFGPFWAQGVTWTPAPSAHARFATYCRHRTHGVEPRRRNPLGRRAWA
jgi:hypothetical protein